MTRPPWLLWRALTFELWRVVLMTTAVVVLSISFAASVQWLAKGRLGPVEMLKFMVLAIPPMLAYALPFASGFGATLAYHRVASDNEMLAAHAGGVSHRSMLVPALVSGLTLAAGLSLLNEQVIPRFLRKMELLVTQDAPKLIVSAIERGDSITLGAGMLHADDVIRTRQPDGTDVLLLRGVAVLELDRVGNVRTEVTAASAVVWYLPPGAGGESAAGERASVAIMLRDFSAIHEGKKITPERNEISYREEVPYAFRDDPKFLTWGELRGLRHEPARMNFIEQRRRDLAHFLAERKTTSAINESLRDEGRVVLESGMGEPIVVRASGIRWQPQTDDPPGEWVLAPIGGAREIEVELLRSSDGDAREVTRMIARRASLRTDLGPNYEQRDLTLRLELEGVRVAGSTTPGAAGEQERREMKGLRPAIDPLPELLSLDTAALIAQVEPRVEGEKRDEFLVGPYRELVRRLEDLSREITSKQHERMAMAAACLVMVLAGAVTAMRLTDKPPLVVYLWSFFPALGAVITIAGGQQVTHDAGAPGLVMLWGGVAILGAYALVAYRAVARH
ncbi:MAG: LptF/LptG family permease [Phycisphaerales bacterium]|nr:LptF/LptG family permease [Phycisphaerales bacterium]